MCMHTPKRVYIEVRSPIISSLVIHIQIITNSYKICNRTNRTSFYSPWLEYWTSSLATDSEIPPTSYEEDEWSSMTLVFGAWGLIRYHVVRPHTNEVDRPYNVVWHYWYLCAVIRWKIKRTNLRSCFEIALARSAGASVQALIARSVDVDFPYRRHLEIERYEQGFPQAAGRVAGDAVQAEGESLDLPAFASWSGVVPESYSG